jgi:hypothetical protein
MVVQVNVVERKVGGGPMVGCVLCCDALFRDGWDRDKEVAGDDMVVVPPQNWLITSIIIGHNNLLQ